MVELTILQRVVDKGHQAEFLPDGKYGKLERRVAERVDSDTGAVIDYPFDPRTRVGPFVGVDKRILNCGARLAGAVLKRSGFNTRVVLGNWNPRFDFRYARLNGRIPEVYGISSMQIHEAEAHRKIEQAASMGDQRPLIIGGGPHANYQGWDFFDRDQRKSADVTVNGEINVIVELMDRILEFRGKNQTMLRGFENARRDGALDSIRGIMYISEDREVLVETGAPKLIRDLDEYPMETEGLSLIEPKSNRRKGLSSKPIPLDKLRKHGIIVSVYSSNGCGLRCSYCPIPRQAQFTERAKSPERMSEEHSDILLNVNPGFVFWTDDNAFTFRRSYQEALHGELASRMVNGRPLGKQLKYGTEGTEAQALIYKDLFPLMARGGLSAVWFGIEDLTGSLVKKGQSDRKTEELFSELRANGIAPMPMMIHFDGQPLRGKNPKKLEGILDQVDFLKNKGAVSIQVTYITPSIGSDDYGPENFDKGTVLAKAGELDVGWYLFDGNHVISSGEEDLLKRQRNIEACYRRFYNPRDLVRSFWELARAKWSGNRNSIDLAKFALVAQLGARRGFRISRKNLLEWEEALGTGRFEYVKGVPESSIPIIQAGDFDNIYSTVGSSTGAVSYAEYTTNMYTKFVRWAERFIEGHRGNVALVRERLTDRAHGLVLHERERFSRLEAEVKRMYHDVGEGAERIWSDFNRRLEDYIKARCIGATVTST